MKRIALLLIGALAAFNAGAIVKSPGGTSGGGGGSGTVTSVGASSSTLTVTGSPVTSSGTITIDLPSSGVPLANLANLAADSIMGNATSSAATPQALNPLAVANLMSASVSVGYVATSNVTLSGSQTVDGTVLPNGSTMLAAAQTTASQNGIYVVNTGGAWTRAINFPAGYVIAQNCNLVVQAQYGASYAGTAWNLNTSSGTTNIGTDSQTWVQQNNIASYNSYVSSTGIFTVGTPTQQNFYLQPVANANASTPQNIGFLTVSGANSPGGVMTFSTANGTEGAGGNMTFSLGSAGTLTSANYSGATLQMSAGAAIGNGTGGSLNLFAGNAAGGGATGGTATVRAGTGGTEGNGGSVAITARNGVTATSTARNGGNVTLTPGTAVSGGNPGLVIFAGPIEGTGTKPTLAGTGACATTGTQVGGTVAGSFVCSGTAGASTVTLTLPKSTNGWECGASDRTAGTLLAMSGTSTTSATLSGTIATSGDVVSFHCIGY